jgi:hypothetical protein
MILAKRIQFKHFARPSLSFSFSLGPLEASAENVRKIIGIIDVTWKISSNDAGEKKKRKESDVVENGTGWVGRERCVADFNKDVKLQSFLTDISPSLRAQYFYCFASTTLCVFRRVSLK